MVKIGVSLDMANKSNKKKLLKKTKVVRDTKFLNNLRHLEKLLDYSWKCVDGKSEHLDDLFTKQSSRILEQINKLKGSQ